MWSKYLARIKIKANFIASEGWKLIPPSVIHLWTFPVPMNFTKIKLNIPITNDKTLNLKKISWGKKAKINIKKIPNINLIKWFWAHGSQYPPAAEYKDATPTKPRKITLAMIKKFSFDNFEKNLEPKLFSENLFNL